MTGVTATATCTVNLYRFFSAPGSDNSSPRGSSSNVDAFCSDYQFVLDDTG